MPSTQKKKRYLLCVRNEGCEDLELRKLYEQIPDEAASKVAYVRVLDESGEDYLYPMSCFVAMELPGEAERALGERGR